MLKIQFYKRVIMIFISPYVIPNVQIGKQKTKKLLVAVGASGATPPGGGGDDVPNFFKNKYTKEQIAKMNEYGKSNNIFRKNFNSMLNHCKKFITK